MADDGNWVQIDLDGGTGYIQVNDCIKLCYGLDTANPTYDVSSYSSVRQNIVTYAMQFLGNAYVWGGNDPHTRSQTVQGSLSTYTSMSQI